MLTKIFTLLNGWRKPGTSGIAWNSKFVPWLIVVMSFGMTCWAAYVAKAHVEESSRQVFEAQAAELTQEISARVEIYNYVLMGVTGLFAASEKVERKEWQTYLRNLQLNSNFPGMVGVGFVKYIPATDLNAHIAEMRAEGFAHYTVHPAGVREEYSSIVFPMPPHGDLHSTLGFDMLTQPQQAKAMDFARSAGIPAITEKINFAPRLNQKAEPGFLMYFPVYQNDTLRIAEDQRRALIIGYVYCRVHMSELLADVFRLYRPGLEMQIHDQEVSADSLLYSFNTEERQAKAYAPAFKVENIMPINNRFWTIRFFSKDYDAAVTERYLYQMIFVGGSVISILFFLVAWALASSRRRAVNIAKQMTAESRVMALKMSHLAQHDFLTDLPNRALLDDRLGQAIAHATRYKRRIAILFIDLDHFKHVNDSLGHLVGDKLLQQVARRLSVQLRDADTLSRQGGDEFVVLLSEIKTADDAALVAGKLQAIGAQPLVIDGHEIHLSLSIGVSIFPEHGLDSTTLMKHADSAMYHAKKLGRNNCQFFTPSLGEKADGRLAIENKLRHAIKNGELRLHYQPKVDFGSRKIVGVEALVRWQRTASELMAPADFIPIAEETGLIVEIDKWVLAEACRQTCAWQAAGVQVVPVSINLSMINFNQQDFFAHVTSVLHDTQLDPKYLEVELTETVLTKNVDLVKETLAGLKSLGLSIAIDDFGTGYSSLSYLTQFPIDTLKIDRAFVQDITGNNGGAAITQAIISMAKSLSKLVVAEGVETMEQAQILQAHDCDVMQGYLFSKPVPAEVFETMLRQPEHVALFN